MSNKKFTFPREVETVVMAGERDGMEMYSNQRSYANLLLIEFLSLEVQDKIEKAHLYFLPMVIFPVPLIISVDISIDHFEKSV